MVKIAWRQLWRRTDGCESEVVDALVIEAPLELRVNGEPFVVIMRTPGHDVELARGLLWAEGVAGPLAIEQVESDVVDIQLAAAEARALGGRALLATSSCGVCGKRAIADLETRLDIVEADIVASAAVVAALPDRLRRAQRVFDATGGLHGAGFFAANGELVAAREDVGRHNAVDKLVGWAAASGRLPASDWLLCVSGRLGFEIVQKTVAAGIGLVAAVSAPSSLAVDVAERFRVTLCGFVRSGGMNIYSHPYRVVD